MTITIKTAADVEAMRIAGRLASEVLDMLTPHVKPGVSTEELDRLAHDHILIVIVMGRHYVYGTALVRLNFTA